MPHYIYPSLEFEGYWIGRTHERQSVETFIGTVARE
jgi:hypothetical protein